MHHDFLQAYQLYSEYVLICPSIMISPGKAIAETALTKLKASFSSLLMDVQSSMEDCKVKGAMIHARVLLWRMQHP